MNKITAFLFATILYSSVSAQQGVSHKQLDVLLKKYVDDAGRVDYKGLKTERSQLKAYLQMIEANPPKSNWSDNQELAYWINAYNAYTLDLVLEHYPVKSIRDIGSIIKIPHINSPWDIKFITLGGEQYDLNKIEHETIRKKFDEPRIHFVLVCAAKSCPKLQNEAFFPETLDTRLTASTRAFLTDTEKNELNGSRAKVSKLFTWYRGDFTKKTSLTAFINRYANDKLEKNARIEYKDYDWSLNEQ